MRKYMGKETKTHQIGKNAKNEEERRGEEQEERVEERRREEESLKKGQNAKIYREGDNKLTR